MNQKKEVKEKTIKNQGVLIDLIVLMDLIALVNLIILIDQIFLLSLKVSKALKRKIKKIRVIPIIIKNMECKVLKAMKLMSQINKWQS